MAKCKVLTGSAVKGLTYYNKRRSDTRAESDVYECLVTKAAVEKCHSITVR